MKYLTIALFLGVASADAIHDAINALKIEVSPKGQKRIESEAHDVEMVLKKIQHSKPVNKLEHALKKWAHTKEVHHIKQIDQAFMKSPLGKKMVKEWTDVGRVLEQNLQETEQGVHFPNHKMDELSNEVDDVADTYEKFFKSKWAKAYEQGWHAALHNQQAKGVKGAAKNFKHSPQGQALKKEMRQLKHAIKQEVHVSDIPEDWKKNADLLKVEVNPAGQKVIEKEFNDVMQTGEAIKHSKPVQRVGHALENWGETKEVQALKALDQKFLKSPEGQALMQDWKEFGEALKKHVQETPNGIHIDDQGIKAIEQEAEDLGDAYEKVGKSKWGKKYDVAWKKALETPEAQKVGHTLDKFGKSAEWHKLEAELKDLDAALQKHVKVSDVPEHWKNNADLLKIEVDETGQDAIEQELDDIENVWKAIEHSEPVQRVGHSAERLANTQEARDLEELDREFMASEDGQDLKEEIDEFFGALEKHVQETPNGIHIDNTHMEDIEDELMDIDEQFQHLEKTQWPGQYDAAFKNLENTKEAADLEHDFENFKHSEEGQALGQELHELDQALNEHVKVSDIPENWKEDMFLF